MSANEKSTAFGDAACNCTASYRQSADCSASYHQSADCSASYHQSADCSGTPSSSALTDMAVERVLVNGAVLSLSCSVTAADDADKTACNINGECNAPQCEKPVEDIGQLVTTDTFSNNDLVESLQQLNVKCPRSSNTDSGKLDSIDGARIECDSTDRAGIVTAQCLPSTDGSADVCPETAESVPPPGVEFVNYRDERQMADIMRLIQDDLSEPYSIYTYRYFINNWPHLCFLAYFGARMVGTVVCKLDALECNGAARSANLASGASHVVNRGYIAMLAVEQSFRKQKIGSLLVRKAIRAMISNGADEVVLETEVTNLAALRLYENLGFVRDKRLFRYYLNGVDALRLKLWLCPPSL